MFLLFLNITCRQRKFVSSKKPDNKNKRPEPVMEWNNKTEGIIH